MPTPGEMIRCARDDRGGDRAGWTQVAVGQMLDPPQAGQEVYRWESGRILPRDDVWMQLIEIFEWHPPDAWQVIGEARAKRDRATRARLAAKRAEDAKAAAEAARARSPRSPRRPRH